MSSVSDNIVEAGASPRDERAAKAERRRVANKERSAEWRQAKKRALPPDSETIAVTLVLCLLDRQTLPPSKRAAREEVIADVLRQAGGTLNLMGHPGVREAMKEYLTGVGERLRTELWHHPLKHMVPR